MLAANTNNIIIEDRERTHMIATATAGASSLARRTAYTITALALVAIGFSSFLRLVIVHSENLDSARSQLASLAKAIENPLAEALTSNNPAALTETINGLITSNAITSAKISKASKPSPFLNLGSSTDSDIIETFEFTTLDGLAQLELSGHGSGVYPQIFNHIISDSLAISLLAIALYFFVKHTMIIPLRGIANSDDPSLIKTGNEILQITRSVEILRAQLNLEQEEKHQFELALEKERNQKLETRRLIEKAKAASKAKNEFIATMSHEIRTPLNGVVGMVEMLRDTELDSNQKHYLDVLYRSGESLLEIINDILDYSKIESDRMLLEKIAFNLEELIENCLKIFGAIASRRDIELFSSVAPDVPTTLVGDPTRLRQIIINLVGNAFKFTTEGHVSLEVNLNSTADDGAATSLQFSISDSGIGIPSKDQSHLFEAFRQADNSTTRKFGGSGLGLAICKQLAELMGGEIGIDSEEGVGSTFWFTSHFDLDRATLKNNPPSSSLSLSGKTLLTINLSAPLCTAIDRQAPRWNLLIQHLRADSDSLDSVAERDAADFVLIDHRKHLPNAFEIVRKIRDFSCYGTTPTLMLTNQQASSFSQMELYSVTSIVPRPIAIQNLGNILISQGHGTQLNPLMTATIEKPNHSALKVLVAEDNAVNRMVIEGLLGKFEIKPDFAENGVEAVDQFFAVSDRYDLVLMDCEMPELDGFGATEQIRQGEKNRALASTPIIALTAHVEASHRQRVFDCGMNHFLSKPVTIDKLNEALNTVGIASNA